MDYRKPACGDVGPHAEHWIPRLGDDIHCEGWTETEADTAALIDRLEQMRVDIAYDRVPESVILECHPLVPYAIQRMWIPGYAEFISTNEPHRLSVPVLVNPEMKPGEWRLVIADGVIREHLNSPSSAAN